MPENGGIMTPKDILGLIVRLSGLLLAAFGIYSIVFAVGYFLGQINMGHSTSLAYFVFGLLYLIGGIAILKKAESIENFCYPSKNKDMQ